MKFTKIKQKNWMQIRPVTPVISSFCILDEIDVKIHNDERTAEERNSSLCSVANQTEPETS